VTVNTIMANSVTEDLLTKSQQLTAQLEDRSEELQRQQEELLQKDIEKARGKVFEGRNKNIQRQILQREADSTRTLYDGLLQQYKDLGIAGATGVNNVAVIDLAQTPGAPWPIQTAGLPPMYSAAWHHVHLYAPRSINPDSNMPAYRFLYEKRRITGERSDDAVQLSGSDALPEGWEIVPSYDAKCLVAYLMALNQSHPLKEAKLVGGAPAAAASPAPAPQGASPGPAPAGSPAPAKK